MQACLFDPFWGRKRESKGKPPWASLFRPPRPFFWDMSLPLFGDQLQDVVERCLLLLKNTPSIKVRKLVPAKHSLCVNVILGARLHYGFLIGRQSEN